MVLVLAFLLLVSLVVSAALAMLEYYAHGILGSSAAVLAASSFIISFGVIACMFSVIYALWFGSLQHERLHLDEVERLAAQQGAE